MKPKDKSHNHRIDRNRRGRRASCCLQDPSSKSTCDQQQAAEMTHPKLTEIIHTDFLDLSPVQSQLAGYDACFFCLGVSSVG